MCYHFVKNPNRGTVCFMRVTFDTVYDLKFGVNAVIVIHRLHKIDLVMRIRKQIMFTWYTRDEENIFRVKCRGEN